MHFPPSSVGQASAALGAATSENLTAVAGSHSLTETVHLGALTLLGLIGTEHSMTPPLIKINLLPIVSRGILDSEQVLSAAVDISSTFPPWKGVPFIITNDFPVCQHKIFQKSQILHLF